ncbi:MAG: VanZ family protein [Planctomycetota bacterium]
MTLTEEPANPPKVASRPRRRWPGQGLTDRALGRFAVPAAVWIASLSLFPYRAPRETITPQNELAGATPEGLDSHAIVFGMLGVLLGASRAAGSSSVLRAIAVVTLSCGVLELLQLLSVGRHPTVLDWLCNSAAVSIGLVLGRRWHAPLQRLVEPRERFLWRVIAIGASVALLLFLGAAQRGFALDGWAPDHALLVGNENGGGRAWSGRVGEIAVYPARLETEDAAALAAAAGDAALRRSMGAVGLWVFGGGPRAVNLALERRPSLDLHAPSGVAVSRDAAGLVHIDGERPWRARESTAALAAALSRTTELSIEVRMAVDDLTQRGPARIVTLSRDPFERNFTVGQQGDALVLRVRCGATGKSAAKYEGVWPAALRAGVAQHFVVTYREGVMHLLRDGVPFGDPYSIRSERAARNVITGGGPITAAFLWFLPLGFALGQGWPRRRRLARGATVAVAGLAPLAAVALSGGPWSVAWRVAVVGAVAVAAGELLVVVRGSVGQSRPRDGLAA